VSAPNPQESGSAPLIRIYPHIRRENIGYHLKIRKAPKEESPPVEPCMRFSRTRLTDALHRRCSVGARQARFGLGATTIPLRQIRPSWLPDR
jgi:hypothetical protein